MAARRQHGEGSLYQRKDDGRWIASVNLGSDSAGKRQRRVFTATTPEAARLKREAFLDRRRDGFTMPKGRPPTVAEWCRHWLLKIARPQVEATTWERSYRSKVELYIIPFFSSASSVSGTEAKNGMMYSSTLERYDRSHVVASTCGLAIFTSQ